MSKIENIYDRPDYYSLEDFEGEIWRQIPGVHPRFFASNLGRTKSIETPDREEERHKKHSRILKVHHGRYFRSYVLGEGNFVISAIHQAVAYAFVGPKPTPSHCVNHKNGIRWDNRPENLEWVTQKENIRHSVETRLKPHCEVAQYRLDGSLVAVYDSINEGGRVAGVGTSNISSAINGRYKTAKGFIWKRITKEEYFRLKEQLTPKYL